MVQVSHPYMTAGKSVALTIQIFVGKVISLLFNMLSRFVITFLPRNKRLLISWLQSPSSVILETKKIKSVTFHCFPIYLPWRRYSWDSRIFSAYSPEHSSWAGMSVFPGSISPGVDFVVGTVQLRAWEWPRKRTAVCRHGQRSDTQQSVVHMCLLEALCSVHGTGHGKRSEEMGWHASPRHIQMHNFQSSRTLNLGLPWWSSG